jgi:single-strand DNA-binding protein
MINKVILLGNLSSDVELKYSPSGTAYAKFSLATNKKGKDGKDKASFHRITCFNKLAENVAKFCKKGKQVYLEGELNYSVSENPDGTKKYFTDIIAFEVKFIGGLKNDGPEGTAVNSFQQGPPVSFTADDIPF